MARDCSAKLEKIVKEMKDIGHVTDLSWFDGFSEIGSLLFKKGEEIRYIFNCPDLQYRKEIVFKSLRKGTEIGLPLLAELFFRTSIGDNTVLGNNVYLGDVGGIDIGDNVKIGDYVQFYSTNHPLDPHKRNICETKPIYVGDNVTIGEGTIILPGIKIGPGAFVCPSNIVSKNVPPNAFVGPENKIPEILQQYLFSTSNPIFSLVPCNDTSDYDYRLKLPELGGVYICPDIWVKEQKKIEAVSGFLNNNTILDATNQIKIGKDIQVGPFCQFYTSDSPLILTKRIQNYLKKNIEKKIEIGDSVWVGGSSIILPGVKIGYGAIIGAGSIVNEDVPEKTVVAGKPAKIIKYIE